MAVVLISAPSQSSPLLHTQGGGQGFWHIEQSRIPYRGPTPQRLVIV